MYELELNYANMENRKEHVTFDRGVPELELAYSSRLTAPKCAPKCAKYKFMRILQLVHKPRLACSSNQKH